MLSSPTSDRSTASPPAAPLLEIDDLAVSFAGPDGGRSLAVSGVSLSVYPGQTLAIVGESGSGKSVTALAVMALLPRHAAQVDRGAIRFAGRDLRQPPDQMLSIRGSQVAMIFQEPMTSLNPVFSVGEQIVEAIVLHQRVGRKAARDMAVAAMHDVGIAEAPARVDDYPHQFSGGMRQRVMIAMALACRPRLLIADEPTSALDVTIQEQILDLLESLRRRTRMAVMLITHDLGLVAKHADTVCVMRAGRVVEYATVFDVLESPAHPYTRALLECKPKLHRKLERLSTVGDSISEPVALAGRLVEVKPNHWVASPAGPEGSAHTPPRLEFIRPAPASGAADSHRD